MEQLAAPTRKLPPPTPTSRDVRNNELLLAKPLIVSCFFSCR